MSTVPPPSDPPASSRRQWETLREHTEQPTPIPADRSRVNLIHYGLAQPFLGLRTLLRSPELLGMALAPMFLVMAIALVAAYFAGQERGFWAGVASYFVTIAALAPVPPLILARVYASLAAKARPVLGLSPAEPYVRGWVQLGGEWLAQLLILALGVLPLTVLLGIVPWVGAFYALCIQGAWALHWIVVEGYDNSRTLPPGQTVEEIEALGQGRPGIPWFHRWAANVGQRSGPWKLLGPLVMLSEVVTSLARPWRAEVDLTEDEPWISLGFGLGIAIMLAIPGLNLALRPAVVVAGVHLRYRLLEENPAPSPTPRETTQPYPTVPPA
ncbi:MAG: hypothetical protein AAF799_39075 [Myxococcota bacterium]